VSVLPTRPPRVGARPPVFAITLLVTLFVLLTLACVFALPSLLIPEGTTLVHQDRPKLENDVRSTLLTGLAFLLGIYATVRAWFAVNERGQITERFGKALEYLGSDKVEVRLGGIYALEQIARDSEGDRAAIIDILTGFVRGHSPWPSSDDASKSLAPGDLPPLRARAADVQAVVTVLGRWAFPSQGPQHLELANVDLRKADLRSANLEGAYFLASTLAGADLSGADLQGAYFRDTDLRQANLSEANLRGSNLTGTDLAEANLSGAHLENAEFGRTHLNGANLRGAHLEGIDLSDSHVASADLGGAHLRGANLQGVKLIDSNLLGADLRDANLRRAIFAPNQLPSSNFAGADLVGAVLEGSAGDSTTVWPEGFDPRAAGITYLENSDSGIPEKGSSE
jgi:uncharacterized protein YjbI with pentapeptide repeats